VAAGVVIVVLWVGVVVWRYWTPGGQRWGAQAKAMKAARRPQVLTDAARASSKPPALSDVAATSPVGLACPKCGGTQFKAHRRLSTKLMFGAASLLGQAKHVRCVTCGTDYLRG
jgi:hypothetical protein